MTENPVKKYVWDDRAPSFRQVGDVAERVARLHSGVVIDEVTHERWRQLMSLLRDFDTWVDDAKVPIDAAVQRLRDFGDFAALYPALTPEGLGPEAFQALIGRTHRILRLGQWVAAAETPYRFACLRVHEGRQTARLLEDSATPAVREQPSFTESFIPTMESLSVVACALDSVTDAREDFRQEKLGQQPTWAYYRQMSGVALAHAGPGVGALLHGGVMAEFGRMSVTRLRNRMAHGVTDSSSLHNLR